MRLVERARRRRGQIRRAPENMNKKQPPSVWDSLALVGQLGLTIALPIALLAILGSFLDGKVQSGHVFLLLGLLLGLISGIYGAYRLLSRLL